MATNTPLATGQAVTTVPAPIGAVSLDSGGNRKQLWARKAIHHITLPSGEEVDIRLPDLGALVAGDAVPGHLRSAAVRKLLGDIPQQLQQAETKEAAAPVDPEKELEETLGLALEFNDWVVSQMLVDPEMSLDELRPGSPLRPPEEDMELLVALAMRERAHDARGVRLGVEPLDRLERFRHFHRCPEGCEACLEYGRDVSTRGLGRM